MKRKFLYILIFAGSALLLYIVGAQQAFGWHYGDRGYGCHAEVGGHRCGGYGSQYGGQYGGQYRSRYSSQYGGRYGGQGGGYRSRYGGQYGSRYGSRGGGYRSRYGGQYRGQYRGQVPPPPPRPQPPTGLTSSCPTPGTSASISWNPSAYATKYQLRVDDTTANEWTGACNGAQEPGDICDNNKTTTNQTFTGTPESEYVWWVHACNVSGCSAASYASFACAAPPKYSISGNIFTDSNEDKTKNIGEQNYTEGTLTGTEWGIPGDVPVPADYDGDGKEDFAVIRQYDAEGGDKIEWYIKDKPTLTWGIPSRNDIPVPADYDGDGKDEVAIYRPGEGNWYIYGKPAVQWGLPGDIPVPADYNGDGKDEFAIYRPLEQDGTEGKWYLYGRSTPFNWGLKDDIPVPGDYNGDGTDEFTVYRSSELKWYTWGDPGVEWGRDDDLPVPADYTGDGKIDFAMYRPADGRWYIYPDIVISPLLDSADIEDVPVPGDYNGDGPIDVGIFSPINNTWYTRRPSTITIQNTPLVKPIAGFAATPSGQGYWAVAADGGVFAYGDAPFKGSLGNIPLTKKIVGMAATPTGQGYWLVAADGGVFAFGDAPFKGSLGGTTLARPISGIAATPSGQGYWLVAKDGGVFAYGDAPYKGGLAGTTLAKPIVGIAGHPTGQGYWLVGDDGGVFAFNAPFKGSLAGTTLAKPIVGIAGHPSGNGYWLVGGDGGVFAYGDAPPKGSLGGTALAKPIVGMAAYKPTGQGYWLVGGDLGVFTFGDAPFKGSQIDTTVTTLTGSYSVGGLLAGNYPVTLDFLSDTHRATHPPGDVPQYSINVGAGFACNGSPIPFGFCDAGNAKEVNFGIKRIEEPFDANRPTVTKAGISSPTVTADGSTPYTITLEATDPQGGNDIGSLYTTINLGGIHAGETRGSFGWDTTGGFQGLAQSDAAIPCTGSGEATVFDFYNPEYVKLLSCEAPPVPAGSNIRTIKLTVAFNTNFRDPINNNKLSGYARDWGGLEDEPEKWRHFDEFSLSNVPPVACSLEGSVFIDNNEDHIISSGDSVYTGPAQIEISKTGDSSATIVNTSDGNYCVPELGPGEYTVTLPTVPSGHRVYPAPPTIIVTIGPGCTVSNNSTGAFCDADNNVQNINFALSNSGNWIQGYNLDMRFDKGFNNPIPNLPFPYSKYSIYYDNAIGLSSGILFTGDSSPSFGTGQGTWLGWLAGGANYEEVYTYPTGNTLFTSYSYLTSQAARGQIAVKNLTDLAGCASLSNCTLPANLENGVYKADSNLNLNAYTFPANKDYIFLINGSLTINGNIKVPKGSTALFSAKNDITVDRSVGIAAGPRPAIESGQLQGFFTAGKNFVLDGNNNCSPADRMLNAEGSIAVNAEGGGGSFTNRRSMCAGASSTPSLTITPRLDFLLNAPPFLQRTNTVTTEAAP